MKKKIFIPILVVIFLLIIIVTIIFTRNKYVGIWNNTIVYDNITIKTTITIKRNGKISFVKTHSDGSGTYSREGKWKKEKKHIVIIFERDAGLEKYPIYLNDNNSFCFEYKDCHKSQIYYKKTLFSKEREYIYETQKQDTNTQKQPQWENITADKDNSDEKVDTNLDIKKDGKVIIRFFRGQGCPHCAEAEEWFESIKGEYGNLFVIIDYETWYDTDNAKLMEAVAKSRGDEVSGVPYIIIGNKSWNGFTESYEQEMINEIKSVSLE